MALVGAVLALRYPYIDASIAFNNTWSFQVLIAALLGGPGRAWGPAVGAIPLVLLSDYLAGTFPHHFSIALGPVLRRHRLLPARRRRARALHR